MPDNSVSGLKSRLQADLTEAIRSRDELRSATIRMVLTAIRCEEVAGDVARELTDEESVAVLTREAKKRREAATAFDGAGRTEKAARERDELGVLTEYLPAQLSDDELTALVAEEVAAVATTVATTGATTGATGMAAMGRVMKALQPRLAGRAEGGRVAAEVRRQLAG